MASATNEPKTYMPLFIGDYLADTSDLAAEEHGAYFLLLITMWRRGGSLPSDGDRLCRIAAVPRERWSAVWAVISGFFDEDGGVITQKRLTKELETARDLKAAASERGRRAARHRWAKKERADAPEDDAGASEDDVDDAPGNAHAMHTQCGRNADAMPEQCTSNARAMLEQCPSPSPPPSPPTSPAPEPIRFDSIRPGAPASAGEVIEYWNDLAEGGWSAESSDGEYLRERLREGHPVSDCCLVVEAAIASGIEHPRRAFSRERFGGLLASRRNPRKWAELRDDFDAVLERYEERTT